LMSRQGLARDHVLRVVPSSSSITMRADLQLVNFMNGANVGVVEAGCGSAPRAETAPELRVADQFGRQNFRAMLLPKRRSWAR